MYGLSWHGPQYCATCLDFPAPDRETCAHMLKPASRSLSCNGLPRGWRFTPHRLRPASCLPSSSPQVAGPSAQDVMGESSWVGEISRARGEPGWRGAGSILSAADNAEETDALAAVAATRGGNVGQQRKGRGKEGMGESGGCTGSSEAQGREGGSGGGAGAATAAERRRNGVRLFFAPPLMQAPPPQWSSVSPGK